MEKIIRGHKGIELEIDFDASDLSDKDYIDDTFESLADIVDDLVSNGYFNYEDISNIKDFEEGMTIISKNEAKLATGNYIYMQGRLFVMEDVK